MATLHPIPPPFFSPYLDDQCTKINNKAVPWEGYQRAKLLSQDELSLLKSLSKLPPAQRPTVFATQGPQYAKLYIDLLRKLQRVDTVQAVLVSINDMLSDTTNISYFHSLATAENPTDPYGPIVKCLGMEEEFPVLGSLRILALLIATDPKPFPESLVPTLLSSLQTLLNGSRIPLWEVAAQVLGAVLGTKQFRNAVWEEEGAISGLIKSLKSNPNPQAQYWAIFSLWQLSFEKKAAEGLDKKYDVVALLTDVAKAAVKEKVQRVVVATFKVCLRSGINFICSPFIRTSSLSPPLKTCLPCLSPSSSPSSPPFNPANGPTKRSSKTLITFRASSRLDWTA
ncbi:hypothetical protein, variant [Cryptococcus amylolentus CBS 6039]|uniref:ATPase V1 complex subunit H C-terminal domain-containing protein n=1 Tax=Cryptococcus amylolentus CBS 6039 TaxID=1295533 RepID=A0A1E3I3E4_9TREE|nr:hypothetical protein, variant [Cryptococcus amylolentus CBS 6039]ODN82885.1 hypothetical protein, variant [Cryptococcus amylolentus CBS 6039]